ncbi:hypothetical protein B0186_05875 [Canicola haemoglobinophilus]|uniref:HEPN domain-containing protein n=1 Tax=Canicola haemoglobinophilus TaxID=733 RepID=A0A1V4B1D7_9PAST|nr:HEPN domain-containing protein [Canicola haemoglobinophilus]OOS00705.1 hypothetical protein B0186_05875 [Canicola haemoglobinophilus]STO60234.1 Uncharacterised protein [Canicola haemoglobinophilus]
MIEQYKKNYSRLKDESGHWHSRAGDLITSAKVLWDSLDKHPFCWNVYKMLMGMAFELLIKAVLTQRNIDFKYTHNLRELALEAQIKLSEEEFNLLDILSGYILWAGKYPVPKDDEILKKHYENEEEQLYDEYMRVSDVPLVIYNGKLDFNNLHEIWMKILESYKL